jgi:hypothetical protein
MPGFEPKSQKRFAYLLQDLMLEFAQELGELLHSSKEPDLAERILEWTNCA